MTPSLWLSAHTHTHLCRCLYVCLLEGGSNGSSIEIVRPDYCHFEIRTRKFSQLSHWTTQSKSRVFKRTSRRALVRWAASVARVTTNKQTMPRDVMNAAPGYVIESGAHKLCSVLHRWTLSRLSSCAKLSSITMSYSWVRWHSCKNIVYVYSPISSGTGIWIREGRQGITGKLELCLLTK